MGSLQRLKPCPTVRSTRCQAVRVSWSSWGMLSETTEVARGASNILPVFIKNTSPTQLEQGPSSALQQHHHINDATLPTRNFTLQQGKSSLPGSARQLTAKLCRCQHWRELQALLHIHAQHINALHLSALVTRLAKVVPIQSRSASHVLDKDLEAFMQDVSALVSRNLDNLDPRGLVNILWSVARLGYRPSYTLVQRYLFAAFVQIQNMKPQEISNLLWAIATMDIKPGAAWLQHLLPHATAAISEMKPQELANFTWAVSKLCTGSTNLQRTGSNHMQSSHGPSRHQLLCLLERVLKTSLIHMTAFQPFELMMLQTSLHRLLESEPLRDDSSHRQHQHQDHNVPLPGDAHPSSSNPASFAAERIQLQLVKLLYSRLLATSADHLSPALASCHILSSHDATNLVCLLAWDVSESTAGQQVWNSATGRLAVLHVIRAVARAGHVLLLSCSRKGLVRLLWGLSLLDARMPVPWLQACLHAVSQTFTSSCSSRPSHPSNDGASSLAKVMWAMARLHKTADQMSAVKQVNGYIAAGNVHVNRPDSSQQPHNHSTATVLHLHNRTVPSPTIYPLHDDQNCTATHHTASQSLAAVIATSNSGYDTVQRPGALITTNPRNGVAADHHSTYLMLPPSLQAQTATQLEHMPLEQLAAIACSLGSLPYRLQTKLVESLQQHIHACLKQVDTQSTQNSINTDNVGQSIGQSRVEAATCSSNQHPNMLQLRHIRMLIMGAQRLNIAFMPEHLVALSRLLCQAIRQHALHNRKNTASMNVQLLSVVVKQFMSLCIVHRNGNRQMKQSCRLAVVQLLECIYNVQQPVMACYTLQLLAQLRIVPREASCVIRRLIEFAMSRVGPMPDHAFSQLLLSSVKLKYSAVAPETCKLLWTRLQQCNFKGVANVSSLLWALAKLKARLPRAIVQQVASQLEQSMSQCSQQHEDHVSLTARDAIKILWALQQYKITASALARRLFEAALAGTRQLTRSQALRLLRVASGTRRRLLRVEWRAIVRQAAGRAHAAQGSSASRPGAGLRAPANRKHMQSLKHSMQNRSMSWSKTWPTWRKIRQAISTKQRLTFTEVGSSL